MKPKAAPEPIPTPATTSDNQKKSVWHAWTRLKTKDLDDETTSKLARVLNLFDLTALGIGSTLGLGVYVLSGAVAHDDAGPAVTISFLLAAVASAFAGVCYAEFAARVPKAGSAYIYSYVTVGEFVAFIIGWNLILEYIIGTASMARGLSGYFDALIDNRISRNLAAAFPIDMHFLADYPDFLAFSVVVILTALLSFGVKESSLLNNFFTAINLTTICIALFCGALNAKISNWDIAPNEVPEGYGTGGFMPYGFAGVMAGAAKCFYAFVGFDVIATTGEEAINAKRNIPLAIALSLTVIFLAYFGISTVLSMMMPYYKLDTNAPFPAAFEAIGWIAVKWVVTIGAVFALCTSLLGSLFPLPRIIYAMGKDGLIFKTFAYVHHRTQTPLVASLLAGLFAATMALIFDLEQLIEMMSIGTLLAYTIVAVCVLILHYQNDPEQGKGGEGKSTSVMRQLWNADRLQSPSVMSSGITKVGIFLYTVIVVAWCTVEKFYAFPSKICLISLGVTIVILILITIIISLQPVAEMDLTFKAPLVPYIPCLSVFANVLLMFQLDLFTWIRFLSWICIGFFMYFCYGMRNSIEAH